MAARIETKPFGTFLELEMPASHDWITDGFLPRGGTMIMGAASKTGKSLFALELCRALVVGDAPFACPLLSVPEPAKVLYLEAEVRERGLQARGRKIFKNISTEWLNEYMAVVSGVPELTLDNETGWSLLKEALQQSQPNVLMLDPIARFLGGTDENSNEKVGAILGRLDMILKDYAHRDLSLIQVHHSRKPDTQKGSSFDPLSPHSMRGASKFFANPDTIFMLDRADNYINATGHKAWRVKGRLETRQSEGFDSDQTFTVNDGDDLKVRWVMPKGGIAKLNDQKVTPPPTDLRGTPGLMFALDE
jgi:AAA domain